MIGIVDTETGRPACVLLAAALGGSIAHAHLFDADEWLLAPTPNLKKIEGTREQWIDYAALPQERRVALIKALREGEDAK